VGRAAGMTLATSAAPLNSERRDTSVVGTQALVSSQQLMAASKHCRDVVSTTENPSLTVRLWHARHVVDRCRSKPNQANFESSIEFRRPPRPNTPPTSDAQDMPSDKPMSNA
jgi:hypothetical protein